MTMIPRPAETDEPVSNRPNPQYCTTFGELFAAEQDVAIQMLAQEFADDPDVARLFERPDVMAYCRYCGRLDERAAKLSERMEITRLP